jgi:gas vesicle protein
MEEYEKPQCHFCMGLLIGAVLGALAGILFAPKSGKELRSDIQEKGSEFLKGAKEIKPMPIQKKKTSSRKPSIKRRS